MLSERAWHLKGKKLLIVTREIQCNYFEQGIKLKRLATWLLFLRFLYNYNFIEF